MSKNKKPHLIVDRGWATHRKSDASIELQGDVFRQLGLIATFGLAVDAKRIEIVDSDGSLETNYLAHLLSGFGFKVSVVDDEEAVEEQRDQFAAWAENLFPQEGCGFDDDPDDDLDSCDDPGCWCQSDDSFY